MTGDQPSPRATAWQASDEASVRGLRVACLHWGDAHGEKDSLSSGVAGAQIRLEIPSAFVAQSLLSAGPLLGSLGAMLTDSKWKVKCLDLTPILNSLLLFWHSPRTLQVSAPRRLYSDNVGIWARPVAIVGS